MTNYPNNYDDSTSLPPADGYDAASINANIGATEAIEFELGLVPSGPYASVRTRLDILEARINNPFAPAPDVLNPFYIGNTGVSIQAGVGNPAVLAVPAVNGSLFLREDGSSFNQVYSYQGGFWTIVGATTGGLAGGDLTGAFPNPKVMGLDGYALSLTSTPTTGQVLAWNGTHWTAGTPGSGTFSAGGDLSGTSISQMVIGIQGNPVSATTPTAGQYLIENTSATGSAWTSLSGDIISSICTPGAITVSSIHGATVPIAGALTTGNVLQVSGISSLSYAPVNLSGGTNYVTGILPITNGGTGISTLSGSGWLNSTAGIINTTAQGPLTVQTVTDWYIDPVGGSDGNNGLTSGTAVKTFREVVARLGTTRPSFVPGTTTTFHILSSQSDLTDPISLSQTNGTVVFLGTPTLVSSTTLGSVAYQPGGTLTATITGATQGYMVVNTTRSNSIAWVDHVSGGTSTLTCPTTANVPVTSFGPALLTTWANGDSVSFYTLPTVYLVAVGNDANNIASSGTYVEHLNIGIPGHNYEAAGAAAFAECSITAGFVSSNIFFDTRGGAFVNCFMAALDSVEIGGSYFYSGGIHNALGAASGAILGKTSIYNVLFGGTGGALFENVEFGPNTIINNQVIELVGGNDFGVGAPSQINGVYTINLYSGTTGDAIGNLTYTGTAVGTFLGTPTLQISGVSFANALDVSFDPAPLHPHRALTPANLDLAVGSGGFGGTAFSDYGVAVFTNAIQGSAAPSPYPFPSSSITPGTAGQVLMTNSTPATTWTTLSGDVTVGSTGITTVNSISGSSPIPITPAQLQWTSTTVTPMLCQAITTLGTGQNLTVQAQNATGFNGGNLILSSGTGNNVGNVQLQAGNVTIARIDSSKLYALKGFNQNVRTIVSSSLVLISDNIVAVGAIVAPITVTLPASPSAGDTYFIKDSTGISLTYNITVNGNGNTIDGFANYIIAQSYACLALVFGNNSWMVV